MRKLATESAIYGVVLVAGLIVIVGESAERSWDVFLKVCATVLVFCAAHVYAGVMGHLDDEDDAELPLRARIMAATRAAVAHSWGMLLAAILPLILLVLGHFQVLEDHQAVWGSLWLCVIMLGLLGYTKVGFWTTSLWIRLASAGITSTLGVLLVLLKSYVH